MSNLIKNELTKIFHKKAIYIILIITLGFMILNCVLTKIFENDNTYDYDTEFYEEQLSYLEKNNPEDREQYIALETEIEVTKLIQKYGADSWQNYVINQEGYTIIQNMKSNEENEEYKKEYEDFIEKLDKGDWRYFAEEELDETNKQIEAMSNSGVESTSELENLKNTKQALEWRLEKNISYETSNLNTFIQEWTYSKNRIYDYETNAKTQTMSYEEEYEKQETVATAALMEYAITNEIRDVSSNYINNTYVLATDANRELINVFSSYSLFIIIAIVMIAGTIVSEEFSKGTIKLLLIRPYKRTKILFAKFITCLIILALTFITVTVLQFIIGGITYGFSDYSSNVIIYNYNSDNVQTVGLIQYVLLTAVAKLPMFILLMTLAFALSVIFNNSPLAIALPLLGIMGAELINQFAYQFEKARFLMYFVTPNWDLSIFLFGKLPKFEPISLPFSIIICAIYFIIMLVVSWIVFKKRDIKNV